MNAWLERYLDLAAVEVVGAALLDSRPAFVADSDGARLIWANAAALDLFRARDMGELAGRVIGERNPLRAQLARLSRLLPSDRARLEALAFPLGSWPAACRRLNLGDGSRAVLAIGASNVPSASLHVRAERLASSLAGPRWAVAVTDRGGRLIGASEAFDARDMARLTAFLAGEAAAGPGRREVALGDGAAADLIAFRADGMALVLLVFVPSQTPLAVAPARMAPEASREAAPQTAITTASATPPDTAAEPTSARTDEPTPEPTAPAAPPAEPTEHVPSAAASQSVAPAETPADDPGLSGSEADAFRRIREALGHNSPPAAPPAPASAAAAVAPPAADAAFDQALLDRLPLAIAIFRDRRTLLANRALLDLLGFDSSDAFAAAGGVDQIFSDGTQAWAAGDFDDRDGRLAVRTRNGGSTPVEARLNTVTFGGEKAFMLSVRPRPRPALPGAPEADPTAAERRILELETILNTATDGVLTVDGHGKIVSMNRAAEALFAVDSGDFKGRDFTDLFAQESRRTALDYLDGLAANGVASVLNDGREVIGRVPHGGLIPLYMTMGRLGDSGRFSAVLRDITHWKTIEEELTAARREAETANAHKSEFLAKISHEIRTPLNAIIGFSEIMIEQRFGPIGNDRYRAYLNDIHVSGTHLMSLINDLLDLSKIEAGKVELSFEAVAVNAVIQECVALMQPLANRERIIIRTSLSTDLPSVVADLRSFRQILLNLLSNAIKFTRAGGQVIVSTLLENSGEVIVRIRDTGIGMTPKEIETAMKPFEQVTTAQGDRDKGTGLGLPLTKAMVEANRATFAIESAPNQGTLVRITFPTTRVLAS